MDQLPEIAKRIAEKQADVETFSFSSNNVLGAAAIGASRIYLAVHFMSNVIAGTYFGAVI
jgi:hypothetical protein